MDMVPHSGNTSSGTRLGTINLLINVAYFVKVYNMSWSKFVSARRSTVLRLPLQQDFPALLFNIGERHLTPSNTKRFHPYPDLVTDWRLKVSFSSGPFFFLFLFVCLSRKSGNWPKSETLAEKLKILRASI
jgi:hypothetical protein